MSLPPFHPFALEYTADPRPYFTEFHKTNKLVFIEDMNAVAVHGYDAVRAFCDHPSLSRNPAQAMTFDPETKAARVKRWSMIEGAMTADPLRGDEGMSLTRELLAPDFRPGMIRKMSSTVHDVVAKVCAPLQFERELDIVSLVQEVPLRVISSLLGIDESSQDADVFLTAAPAFFRGINALATDELRDQAEVAAQQMFGVLGATVEARKKNPQTDMISQVLEIGKNLEGVTPDEIVRALVILVAAGTDTTRLSTSLAAKTLLTHPDQFEALRADRDAVKNSVMELLRYESPTKFLVRVATEDFEWEGQTVPSGAIALLSIFGAGWDPRAFPEPSRFDLKRDLKGSLSFGFGAGYCLGVHLARLQVGEIVQFFLDHLPSTAEIDFDGITWDPRNLMLREITCLPVRVR